MAEYKRDVSELKRAIGAHRIAGYPVRVPVFGDAFAISSSTSIAPSGGITGVMVRPATPMPFETFARIMMWSDAQLHLESWLDNFKKSGRTKGSGMSMIPADIQDRLERGETASMKDIQEFYLMAWGCLDLDRNVTCYSFPLTSVEIPPEKLRPGMLVEFYDRRSGRTDWMGRVAGFDIDPEDDSQVVVLVELFEPTPYLSLPKASSPGLIRPGFYSSNTWVLGKDVAEEMRKSRIPLPSGRWDIEDPENAARRRLYYLENPMPIAELEAFCRTCPDCIGDPEEIKACTRNSMIMYVAPIHPGPHANSRMHQGGIFRPLPEDALEGLETEVVGLED